MKKISQILLLFLIISCGTDTKKEQTKKATKNKLEVCDLLNQDLLKKLYPNATDFKQEFSENTYPTCKYAFVVGGKTVKARITAAFNFGSRKNFDAAMSNFSKKELIKNVGKKAYYLEKMNQLSAWEGKNIIHVNIGNDKEKTIAATKIILKKME